MNIISTGTFIGGVIMWLWGQYHGSYSDATTGIITMVVSQGRRLIPTIELDEPRNPDPSNADNDHATNKHQVDNDHLTGGNEPAQNSPNNSQGVDP